MNWKLSKNALYVYLIVLSNDKYFKNYYSYLQNITGFSTKTLQRVIGELELHHYVEKDRNDSKWFVYLDTKGKEKREKEKQIIGGNKMVNIFNNKFMKAKVIEQVIYDQMERSITIYKITITNIGTSEKSKSTFISKHSAYSYVKSRLFLEYSNDYKKINKIKDCFDIKVRYE